jgi:hypothetical protein
MNNIYPNDNNKIYENINEEFEEQKIENNNDSSYFDFENKISYLKNLVNNLNKKKENDSINDEEMNKNINIQNLEDLIIEKENIIQQYEKLYQVLYSELFYYKKENTDLKLILREYKRNNSLSKKKNNEEEEEDSFNDSEKYKLKSNKKKIKNPEDKNNQIYIEQIKLIHEELNNLNNQNKQDQEIYIYNIEQLNSKLQAFKKEIFSQK